MTAHHHLARDISYAHSGQSRPGRAMIRLLENSTGRRRLIWRAAGYEQDLTTGGDFWSTMAARYGLTLDIVGGALANIPANGPLILIANHPYGILDGLMMGYILSQARSDFRILANKVFQGAPELDKALLPISFEDSKEALRRNLQTRKTALEYLGQSGAIGVFPGGTVSTAVTPMAHPMDPGWRSFTARMIGKSNATVVPVFFDGHCSRLFQIASHLHVNLRLGLLIQEFRNHIDTPVRVVIGAPISRDQLQPLAGDAKAMMDFLRKATYELSPKPLNSYSYGYEFEDRHRA